MRYGINDKLKLGNSPLNVKHTKITVSGKSLLDKYGTIMQTKLLLVIITFWQNLSIPQSFSPTIHTFQPYGICQRRDNMIQALLIFKTVNRLQPD